MTLLLGHDVGSSSIKATLMEAESGKGDNMAKKRHKKITKTRDDGNKIMLVYGEPQKSHFGIITIFIGVIGIFMAVIAILITIIIFMLTKNILF